MDGAARDAAHRLPDFGDGGTPSRQHRRARRDRAPSIGVVLNVGTAHLGEFGSREVIAQTKAELPQAVPHSGAVVLNADDPAVAAMAKLTAARVVRVSRDNTGDVWAGPVSLDELARPRFTLHAHDAQAEVRLGVCGDHQVTNALCAAAVALECGASVEQVAAALTAAPPVSRHRMQVTTRGDGVTVIDDAYNANPDSMRAGLQALAWIAHQPEATRRSWAVLGEMAELGEDAIAEHDRIGRLAVRLDVSRLVVVGTGRSISAMHHGAVLEGAWGSGKPLLITVRIARPSMWPTVTPPWHYCAPSCDPGMWSWSRPRTRPGWVRWPMHWSQTTHAGVCAHEADPYRRCRSGDGVHLADPGADPVVH